MELVRRMAEAFRGKHIEAALRALIDDPMFSDGPDRFKDPAHYVLSGLRAAYDQRVVLNTAPIQGWLNRLGEGLYNRQTPDGYPLVAEAWSGSGQMAARFDVARAIASNNANLFKRDDGTVVAEAPALSRLSRTLGDEGAGTRLRDATRAALARAGSTQEWNMLYLASPDFMVR